MSIILGIDPGYERCGYAVIRKAKTPEIIDLGVIKTSSGDPFPLRLQEIGEDITQLINKHKPEIVGLEDLFFVQNITTGLKVAEVRGVITYLTSQNNAVLIEPKPVEVKKFFTGNGKADKKEMLIMAEKQFDLPQTKIIDDAVDALAIAYYALQHSSLL